MNTHRKLAFVPAHVHYNSRGLRGIVDLCADIARASVSEHAIAAANPDGPLVVIGQLGDMLEELEHIMCHDAERLAGLRLLQLVANRNWLDERVARYIWFTTGFGGKGTANAPGYVDVHLADLTGMFSTPEMKPAVAIVMVSEPDENGVMTIGTDAGLSANAVMNADVRVAIVNPYTPRFVIDEIGMSHDTSARTGCAFHVSDFHYFVRLNKPYPEQQPKLLSAEQARIADALMMLLPDDAWWQVGIGMADSLLTPDRIAKFHNIGALTEMLCPNLWALHTRSAAEARARGRRQRLAYTSFVAGSSQTFLDTLDRDTDTGRLLRVIPAEELVTISGLFNLVKELKDGPLCSVNGARLFDALGSVAAQGEGTERDTGTGGAVATAQAAHETHGMAINVMLSTVRVSGETRSRVVSTFIRGTQPSRPAAAPKTLVTEWGCVRNVHLLPRPRRLTAMVGLCHPAFREEMRAGIEADYGVAVDLEEAADVASFEHIGLPRAPRE